MITFDVSPVEPNRCPLPRSDLFTSLQERMKSPVVACGGNAAGVVSIPRSLADWWANGPQAQEPHPGFVRWNGFIGALAAAFAGHYPLVLSPDDIWLCIAQGLAMHMNRCSDALRGRFAGQEERMHLFVDGDEALRRDPANPWPEVIAALSGALAPHIGKKRDLFVANFSTTGPVERAVTEIVLLDAMHSYFFYHVGGLCGIPRITLRGTVDDWRGIRFRVQNLTEYQLEDWVKALLPVIDQIVATAEGKPDAGFWRRIFRTEEVCGVRLVDGWCNVLFPYLTTSGQRESVTRNAYLHFWQQITERSDGRGFEWVYEAMELGERLTESGEEADFDSFPPRIEQFPSGLSIAPFTWKHGEEELPMELLGGFVGLAQHDDRALQPVIGWGLGVDRDDKLQRISCGRQHDHLTRGATIVDRLSC